MQLVLKTFAMFCLLVLLVASGAGAADTWSGFRGDGSSHATAKNLPTTWESRGRSERNWTIRLPGYGQSSPVVWKDHIFVSAVSGDNKEKLHTIAVSLTDGSIVWQKEFDGTQQVKDSDAVSRGAPTPTVDAEHVYYVFESGDILVLTHAGELVWKRSFVKEYGDLKGPHGFASSPVLVGNGLILQVAHGGPSYILAVDKKTGENLWKVDHPSQTGWSTPVAVEHAGKQLIICSTAGSVRALDALSGKEVWNVQGLQGNSTPSPTIASDFVVIGASSEPGGGRRAAAAPAGENAPAAAPAPPMPTTSTAGSLAIRLGGEGDVTESHILWQNVKASAGYASPLVVEGLAYFVNRVGVVTCVDAATGEVKWTDRLPGPCWTSPIASEGRVFFFCKEGAVAVYQQGAEKKLLGENSLSTTDVVYGVAAVDGSWIIRTGRGLVRVSGASKE